MSNFISNILAIIAVSYFFRFLTRVIKIKFDLLSNIRMHFYNTNKIVLKHFLNATEF